MGGERLRGTRRRSLRLGRYRPAEIGARRGWAGRTGRPGSGLGEVGDVVAVGGDQHADRAARRRVTARRVTRRRVTGQGVALRGAWLAARTVVAGDRDRAGGGRMLCADAADLVSVAVSGVAGVFLPGVAVTAGQRAQPLPPGPSGRPAGTGPVAGPGAEGSGRRADPWAPVRFRCPGFRPVRAPAPVPPPRGGAMFSTQKPAWAMSRPSPWAVQRGRGQHRPRLPSRGPAVPPGPLLPALTRRRSSRSGRRAPPPAGPAGSRGARRSRSACPMRWPRGSGRR